MRRTVLIAFIAVLVFPAMTAKKSSLASPVIKPTVDKIELVVTAYYKPLRGQKRYATGSYRGDVRLNGTGITFFGQDADEGCAAADLTILPKGSLIKMPDDEILKIGDIGKDIKGNKLDKFVGSGEKALARALEQGKRKIVVEILRRGDH